MIVFLFALGVALFLSWSPRMTVYKPVPANIINSFNQLVFHGKLQELKVLVERNSDLDWTALGKGRRKGLTAIHHALNGRFRSLSSHTGALIGGHEDIISYLVKSLHWDTGVGCPVYHALHLRNLPALEILLNASDLTVSLKCLTNLDTNGETALHAAVKSKASGLTRLYSKLLVNNGSEVISIPPSYEVAQLLGLALKPAAVTPKGELSLHALNKVILHTDIELIANHFGHHLNLSIVDKSGNSLLHNAAYGGRNELVKFLLQLGADLEMMNHNNMTPLQLAIAGGHEEVINILMHHGARDNSVCTSKEGKASGNQGDAENRAIIKNTNSSKTLKCMQTRFSTSTCSRHWNQSEKWLPDNNWIKYISSEWIGAEQGKSFLKELHGCGCELQVVSASDLGYEKFVHNYLAKRKPVLITGLVDFWPAWSNWRKEKFMNRYGDVKFTATKIPYADLYLHHPHSITTSLSDYIQSFTDMQHSPYYVFDGKVLEYNSLLAADCPVPPLFSNFSISLRQFILGPRYSGAPPHFHSSAFNVLVYGAKQWTLWPPGDAFFSFAPVDQWMEEQQESGTTGLNCLQLPGDVVFLPEGWGHAVVNRQHSIAVAMEFS